MEDLLKDKNIDNYPNLVLYEDVLKILEQMQKSVCKIYIKGGGYGTGFFCNIEINNKKIPTLITNNSIINEDYIKNNKIIVITLNNDKKEGTILLNENNCIYTSEKYGITIIGLKSINEDIYSFMELDKKLFFENNNYFYEKASAYIIQYSDNKLSVSNGIINNIDEYTIFHLCNTGNNSSGSPILNSSNNKIIGIHTERSDKYHINKGTLLKEPIKEFINKYSKECILGNKDFFKDSTIITKKEDSNFIISSLSEKIKINNIELLYRASINGKTVTDFKKYCNNKGATLIVVQTKKNEIFGGFTKCDWTNENFTFSKDDKAFLYSITNKKIFDILIPEKAIINYDEGYAFACFGNTNDWDGLYFSENDHNINGYNNTKKLTNIYNIKDSKELCSDKFFEINEMEVYQIK